MLSLADFRTPAFNLSVARDDVELEDEFELFMQLFGTSLTLIPLFAGRRRRPSGVCNISIASAAVRLITKPVPQRQNYCTQC